MHTPTCAHVHVVVGEQRMGKGGHPALQYERNVSYKICLVHAVPLGTCLCDNERGSSYMPSCF